MTQEPLPFDRPRPGAQPPDLYPDYASTVKRAPHRAPIRFEHTLSEVTGPVFADRWAGPDTTEGKRARDAAAAQAREGGAGVIADAMLPKMLAPGAPEGLVARVRALMAATPVPGIVGALGAMRDRPDSTSLLPALAGLPALVIAGGSDQLMPVSEMSAMAAAIPGARLVVAPGAGHLPTLETPSIVTDALQTFLAQPG